MKIRLVILTGNKAPIERIAAALTSKHSDKLEVLTFTDSGLVKEEVSSQRVDVLLLDESEEIPNDLPAECAAVYLVEQSGANEYRGHKAICVFQKLDVIYKQILDVYAENAPELSLGSGSGAGSLIAFASPVGGKTVDLVAPAFARRMAARGKRVLYLNLECFGSADLFFHDAGQYGISDLIAALKSRKGNLALKLESCVNKDPCGVCFFSQTKLALDRMEMNTEETIKLLAALKQSGNYDLILIQFDFEISRERLSIYRKLNAVVFVLEDSDVCRIKTERALEAAEILGKMDSTLEVNGISLLYCSAGQESPTMLERSNIRNLGSIPMTMSRDTEPLLAEISAMDQLDQIWR